MRIFIGTMIYLAVAFQAMAVDSPAKDIKATQDVKTTESDAVKDTNKEPAAEVRHEKDKDMERYYSRDYRFSVAFPADWELATDKDPASLGAIGHKEDAKQTFRENVLIGSFDLGGNMSLLEYFNGNLQYLKEKIPELKVLSQDNLKVDNQDAIKVLYTSTIDNKHYKTMQVFVVKGGRGYIFTAMDEVETYDTYIPVFDSIMKSFRFE